MASERSRLNASLFRSTSANKLARVDESKRLGMVTALEIDRLVIAAVDVNDLAGPQAYAEARTRVAAGIAAVPHHDIYGAKATTRHIERYNALIANRCENGLMRPDRT
jgi:hypothetical protein